MLKDNEIDELIQPIVNLYSLIEQELVVEIAKRFKNYDKVKGSLEWQLKKLDELGGVNKELVEIIKKYSGKSDRTVKSMLKEAGYANLDVDTIKAAYAAGKATMTAEMLMQSDTVSNIINLSYKALNDTFSLINTKAIESAKQNYINILNTAYLDTATGIYSFDESIKRSVKEMARNGFEGATYIRQGKVIKYSIEGVVRRDTLSAVHKLANQVSEQACEELGTDYVEISQHLGARVHPTNPIANHAGWQGKVFKIHGSDKKYGNLKENTGYPDDILGLGGVNCRHRMFPFFPGISVPNPIRYNEEENSKAYKSTQGQRRLEREIRRLKKEKAAMKAIGDNEAVKLIDYKLKQKFEQIDNYCDTNNLKRDYSRELVSEQIVKKSLMDNDRLQNNHINDKISSFNEISNIETPITNEAIENVKKIEISGFSKETNTIIHEQRKHLLKEMQKYPVGTEGSVIINLLNNQVSNVRIGDIGKTKIDNIESPYYAIHNHPDNGCLSPGDLINFCNRENMQALESVANNGVDNRIILKTTYSDSKCYKEYIKREVDNFLNKYPDLNIQNDYEMFNSFCDSILKEGRLYGYKIK